MSACASVRFTNPLRAARAAVLAALVAFGLALAAPAGASAEGVLDAGSPSVEPEVVDSGTCGDGLTWQLDDQGLLTVEGAGKIRGNAFKGDGRIKAVVAGDGVTSIGTHAFDGCSSLASFEVPATVASIGGSAFEGCGSLASVSFAEGSKLGSIESAAFFGCSSLASFEVPASVTSIGNNAFESCSSLASFEIPASVASIDGEAFRNCSSLASVSFAEGSELAYISNGAFSFCSKLASVVIPASVTDIGGDAFKDCTSLASVVVPASVTSIGGDAFNHCSSMRSAAVLGEVTSFGGGCFSNLKEGSVVYVASKASYERLLKGNGLYDPAITEAVSLEGRIYSVTPTEVIVASVSVPDVAYGEADLPRPAATVKVGSETLVEGVDYTCSFSYNAGHDGGRYAGGATAEIVGKGSYEGSAAAAFRVTTAADVKAAGAGISAKALGMTDKVKDGEGKVAQASSKTMKVISKPKENTATVTWGAVEGATNYILGYKLSTVKDWSYVVTGGKASYTFSGISEGSLIEYRVAVYDGKKSARSEWTQINCRFYREMVSLKDEVAAGRIDLRWGKVSGATGYQVLIGAKGDLSDAQVVTFEGNSTTKKSLTTFKGKALSKGKTYYLKMRAIKKAANVNGKVNTYVGIHSLRRTAKITSAAKATGREEAAPAMALAL